MPYLVAKDFPTEPAGVRFRALVERGGILPGVRCNRSARSRSGARLVQFVRKQQRGIKQRPRFGLVGETLCACDLGVDRRAELGDVLFLARSACDGILTAADRERDVAHRSSEPIN